MLTPNLVVLAKCLQALNGHKLDKLEERIVFQKTVYLLQATGIDLKYVFQWDMYGPYSQGLAKDAELYQYSSEELHQFIADNSIQFTEDAQRAVSDVKDLIRQPDGARSLRYSAWLELLGSLHFLASTQAYPDKDRLVRTLIERKPHFEGHEAVVRGWFTDSMTVWGSRGLKVAA